MLLILNSMRNKLTITLGLKSSYNKNRKRTVGEDTNLYGIFWNIKASPRALHFAYKVLLNRIATCDNLTKRGVNVISRECVMRGRIEETIQHLFFNCIFVGKIWNMCEKWIRIVTIHHNIAKNHF